MGKMDEVMDSIIPPLDPPRQNGLIHPSPKRIKNRRYQYLQQNAQQNPYFSLESMKLRDPLLYQELVGRYIPNSERKAAFRDDMTLLDRVYDNMASQQFVERFTEAKERMMEEEFETESDDDNDNDVEKEEDEDEDEGKEAINVDEILEISIDDREGFKQEFIRIMHERWLDGDEDDFDYSTVDRDETLDLQTENERDLEDQYFDEEEPSTNNEDNVRNEEFDY